MDYAPNFQNLPLFQLLQGIEENKRRVAGEQFTGSLASILNSTEPDEVKRSKILSMLNPKPQKSGILETLGGILNRVNPNAPYEGNIAAESPILQQLIAGRAGQIFETPEERAMRKNKLDMGAQELARSKLVTGQMANEIRPDIGNTLDRYMNDLGINMPSVFNQGNQENGGMQPVRSVNTKGISYYNQPKPIDTEMRNAKLANLNARTKKTQSAVVSSVGQQMWDRLDDTGKDAATDIHFGRVPKAIGDEQKEYQRLRNEALKYKTARDKELDPIKKQALQRHVERIEAQTAKLKEVKAKTPNAHIDTLNKMLLDATTMTQSGVTIPLSQDQINPAQIKYIEGRAKLYGYRLVQNQTTETIPGTWGRADTTETTITYSLEPIEDGADVAAPETNQPITKKSILKTATNPKTGQKIGWDGSEWIPIQ